MNSPAKNNTAKKDEDRERKEYSKEKPQNIKGPIHPLSSSPSLVRRAELP